MKRTPFRGSRVALVLLCLAAAWPLLAPPAGAKPAPLLDRELFFGDPEISGAQISPDGRFIAFIRPLKGTRNIWVKRTGEPFEKARPVTGDMRRPIPAFFWSRDGKFILYVQDRDGDENYNIWAVDPAAPAAEGKEVPPARNLTGLQKVRAMIYAVPKSDPDLIYIGLNDRDATWHDLYSLRISTGERRLIRQNTERIASWFFDNKGTLRLALRVADNGDTEVLRVDEGGFTRVYSCSVFEDCGPVRYHKDNERVYLVTNKGAGVDLQRLVLFDPRGGKEELIESDPLNRVDLGSPLFSDLTDELIGTAYEDERTRIYWRDESYEADYKRLQKKLKGMEIGMGSSTRDERLWLIAASSDREPGERYLYDRQTKKLTLQYRVYENLPRKALAPMEAIRYRSVDGLEIPAFLTLPPGADRNRLPLIVFPHGGPWYRDSWGYNPFAQFLANRGYAVLQPNFRGSTGYGKKFLNAGNLEWGGRMQDDITWGVKELIARGIADPKRVGIMGGSYGGYATLAGVAFTPDLYAAAVSIVGPSNLLTFLDSIPPYWEAARKIFDARLGDPKMPEGKAQLERQSPLNSVNRIKTPLLVVQGANDPRVNKAESDQIVVALRDRGFPVEYLVADDEGHGFAKPVNNMAMMASAEKFLAKHLGGRYQEGATSEVAKRLAEMSVDVRTVTLPRKIDAASVGLPKPAMGLTPGIYRYKSRVEVGGQTIPVSTSREIREEGGSWVVTDSVSMPMGEAEDKATLEKGSLVLASRSVRQGPVTLELAVTNNKATGTMSMGGQAQPIAKDLGGPLFADGPGGLESLGALPLAEGFTATYRNFDLQRQKEKLMQMKVAGTESVTVPAGTFESWRIEIASAEGEPDKASVWIARDTRRVVKSIAVLPQMGGATVTTELAP